MFSLNSSIKYQNFLLLSWTVKGCGEIINVLSVYEPQKVVDKRALWARILSAMHSLDGFWVVLGDIDVVRCAEERKNSKYKLRCARDLNDFIHESSETKSRSKFGPTSSLCEYPLKGSRYTFMVNSVKGKKTSKIDRVFFCHEFQNKWSDASLCRLPHRFSDHNPLLLLVADLNYGPKPFRFFNSWFEKPNFEMVVAQALESPVFEGPTNLVLMAQALVLEDRDLDEDEEWIRMQCKKDLEVLEQNKAKDEGRN
ncbi:putative Endonuclease/exonuclease/phosphatase superfamily [Helianthus anomalus]